MCRLTKFSKKSAVPTSVLSRELSQLHVLLLLKERVCGRRSPLPTQLAPLSSRATVIYLKNVKLLDCFQRSPNLSCPQNASFMVFFFLNYIYLLLGVEEFNACGGQVTVMGISSLIPPGRSWGPNSGFAATALICSANSLAHIF